MIVCVCVKVPFSCLTMTPSILYVPMCPCGLITWTQAYHHLTNRLLVCSPPAGFWWKLLFFFILQSPLLFFIFLLAVSSHDDAFVWLHLSYLQLEPCLGHKLCVNPPNNGRQWKAEAELNLKTVLTAKAVVIAETGSSSWVSLGLGPSRTLWVSVLV